MSSVSTLNRTVKKWGNWKKLHYITLQQKALKPSLLEEVVGAFAAWLQKAHANNICNDGTNIREKTSPITIHFEIDRSAIFSGWINRFKRRHNTDTRTLAGETGVLIQKAQMTGKMTDCCCKRLYRIWPLWCITMSKHVSSNP